MSNITKEVKKGLLEDILLQLNATELNTDNILSLSSAYQRIASTHNNADVEENLLVGKVGLNLLVAIKDKQHNQVDDLSKAYQRILTTHHNNSYQGDKA